MKTTTFVRRLLWGVAMLAALGVRPAAAGTAATTQQEREIERTVRTQIELGRQRSELGITVRDIEDAADEAPAGAADDEGAVVTDVRAEGPADAAGIEPGDVIVEFDGERVRSARQLARLVEETPVGRDTPLRVLRDGSPVALRVTPAETQGWTGRLPRALAGRVRVTLDELRGRVAETEESTVTELEELEDRIETEEFTVRGRLPEVFRGAAAFWRPGRVRLGIRAESIGGQLAEYFGAGPGVLVAHVDDDTTGAAAGLRAGDVITAIDGDAVDDLAALRRRLAGLEVGAAFEITIVRDRTETSLTAEPAPEEEENRRPGRRGSRI